jgi:hypothetical protein
MRRVTQVLAWVFASAIYWIVAAFVVLFVGWALPGDCGTESTQEGLGECVREARIIVVGALALVALLYGFIVWRIARRR